MAHCSLSPNGRRIRDEVAGLASGRQRRYPARLQRMIVNYAKARLHEGVARVQVCTELGVSDPTLCRLLDRQAQNPRLRPVRVVADAAAVAAEVRKVVVKAPGGIVVEGLDIVGVAALVRALSC